MKMETTKKSKKNRKRERKQPEATETPLLLRGDDDNEDCEAPAMGILRYVTRPRGAVMSRVSAEDSENRPEKRRTVHLDDIRPTKKPKSSRTGRDEVSRAPEQDGEGNLESDSEGQKITGEGDGDGDGEDSDDGDGDEITPVEGDGVGKERRPLQDSTFPGEDYSPPRMIDFNRGKCIRTSDTTAQVRIQYEVKTAMECPCEDRKCRKLVNIGTWGQLGCGSTVCVHCGFKRQGEWHSSGYGFMGKEDLLRHVNTAKCLAKRGFVMEKKSLKQVLGELMYYKIDNPKHTVMKKDKNGNVKKHYKCFVCGRIVGFRSRHMHHINAKHATEVREEESSS